MKRIVEPAKEIPVAEECDVCVIGGSCTGVFAAIRAARLGAKVVIIEKMNSFGGVATQGLVNYWHSQYDTEFKKQIAAGMSLEVVERLGKRNAVAEIKECPHKAFMFNSEELKIELDEIITEQKNIVPFLHTHFAAPFVEDGKLKAVFVENKDGRQAIKAKVFIDASGDGDLAFRMGVPFVMDDFLQPPTTCAKIRNLCPEGVNYYETVKAHYEEFGLEKDCGWSGEIPGCKDIRMYAETHVFNTNAADARQLTNAEIKGRRQTRAIMDIFRKYAPSENMILLSLASYIGIRETRRFVGEYRLTEEDVLEGKSFDDTIANGSYRVDVHNKENGGFLFKYLDGRQENFTFFGMEKGRWRPERKVNPTYYQIPYRTMVNRKVDNLIFAGRTVSTDKAAFGAVRVMINLNQTGEAAGVAAVQSLDSGKNVCDIDTAKLRETLKSGGSIIL
ncbi:MAG TPA: FAD-dependent oxidoreductase [Lentisphaeria bacterium]|nr:MAG: hypothetical protein A2X45_18535 [Lentisphaerae bacterium GWF2_50_93]HCE46903.1 FAD-dependent oxidoreductase [Lentisphaeria bacterium]